jgi:hypothetical protein
MKATGNPLHRTQWTRRASKETSPLQVESQWRASCCVVRRASSAPRGVPSSSKKFRSSNRRLHASGVSLYGSRVSTRVAEPENLKTLPVP